MVASWLVRDWFNVGYVQCCFRVGSALAQGCYKSFPTLILRALIHIFISSRASLVRAWGLPGTSFRLDFSAWRCLLHQTWSSSFDCVITDL